jgi:hypothetical protein
MRIFEPLFEDPKKTENRLFSGEHVRTIYIRKVTGNQGLAKFAVVKESCLNCKNVLPPNCSDYICDNCQSKKKEIYIERKLEQNMAEKVYADLWVQC